MIGGQVGAAILTAQHVRGTHVPTESAFVTMFWISAISALLSAAIALFVTTPRRRRRLVPAAETS